MNGLRAGFCVDRSVAASWVAGSRSYSLSNCSWYCFCQREVQELADRRLVVGVRVEGLDEVGDAERRG